jgi:ABC-type sugar transport system permease subunit
LAENQLQNWWWRRQQRIAPYVFVLPFFVMFAVFWIGPIISSLWISLTEWNGIGSAKFVGLSNYARLFDDRIFHIAIRNTLMSTIVYDVFLVVMAICLALLVELPFLRWHRFFRSALLLPVTISLAVVALIFQLIYTRYGGVANQLFGLVGIGPIDWLGNPDIALWAIVAMRLWRATGYYGIIVLAGLQNIPQELLEAASIDGASRPKAIWHIVLPLLKPIISFVVISSSIWALQLFDEPWILTQGGPMNSTMTMVVHLYQNSFQYLTLGYGAAISYVLTLIILAFSLLQLRLFRDTTY